MEAEGADGGAVPVEALTGGFASGDEGIAAAGNRVLPWGIAGDSVPPAGTAGRSRGCPVFGRRNGVTPLRAVATIDDEGRAGGERGVLGGQEQDARGHFFGGAESAHGLARHESCERGLRVGCLL